MNFWKNAFTHWKTTVTGLLTAAATVGSVFISSGVGPAKYIGLASGVATALLGMVAKDPDTGSQQRIGQPNSMSKGQMISRLAWLCLLFMPVLLVTGCGAVAVWLQDANAILPVLISSATSIISLIGLISGSDQANPTALAALQKWAAGIQQALQDLEQLVADYNSSPSTTIMEKIEAAVAALQKDLQQDLAQFGVSEEVQARVGAIVGIIATELAAWATLLPVLTASGGATVTLPATTVQIPSTKAAIKSSVNAVLSAPTTSSTLAAALEQVRKV